MNFEYIYQDDSREKEGDLAREGFVHILNVDGTGDEIKAITQWCKESIKFGWMEYRISMQGKYMSSMYFKALPELIWTKLLWS